MTGPEHFREAERLLQPVGRYFNGGQTRSEDPPSERAVAQAQVHATLALAAATAEPWAFDTDDRSGAYVHDRWVEVLS